MRGVAVAACAAPTGASGHPADERFDGARRFTQSRVDWQMRIIIIIREPTSERVTAMSLRNPVLQLKPRTDRSLAAVAP
ncbi:hypothetical protein RNS23_11770, partial [Staphylococcus pseudintermedius]|nr:hypothetical protein [Staphylococcus pseudintermedius]